MKPDLMPTYPHGDRRAGWWIEKEVRKAEELNKGENRNAIELKEYLDTMQLVFTQKGVRLTIPEERK